MNCKHVQELLPLYVGGDLKERRAQLVAEHVRSCAECAGAADEYRETRQLLQQFTPPPFSEAVYAGVRQRVLREISDAPAPGLSGLLASLFRPRRSWAVATALLVAVSVLALYFIASRRANPRNGGQQVAGSSRAVDRANGGEQSNVRSQGRDSAVSRPSPPKENDRQPPASTGRNTSMDTVILGSVDRTNRSQRRKSSGSADRAGSVAVNTPEIPSTTAAVSPTGNNPAEPTAVPAPASSEKILRVEMQTQDPNIRIIWFSHQRTKQDLPNKFSKGI